ncbi:MAG: nitrogen regulation protein NR(II) [Candidatus Methylomirabilales bacterium]
MAARTTQHDGLLMQRIPALFDYLVEKERLSPTFTVFALLRLLVILGATAYLVFAPLSAIASRSLLVVLTLFTAYSAGLYVLLWRGRLCTRHLDLWVLAIDLAFCTAFVRVTGGVASDVRHAFYLISALQAYYYGMSRGLAVAAVSSLLYLASDLPALPAIHWTSGAVQLTFLFLLAASLGLMSDRERSRREVMEQLNRRLEQERERIQRIVGSIQDGIIVLDREGTITDWNWAMRQRYGVSAAEVVGKGIFEVFPRLREGGLEEQLAAIWAGRVPDFTLRDLTHETRDRGKVVLTLKGSALHGSRGEISGAVLVVEDTTESVRMRQAVQQAEKLATIGTLSAGIAHEINNPIGVISSRIELMLLETEGARLPGRVREDLRVIAKHADRVAKITRGLLSFARQQPWQVGWVDVNKLVDECLLLMEKQLIKEKIKVEKRLAAGLRPISGSANHLEQVVVNLLSNAREAMPEGGTLTVKTASENGGVVICVGDSGPGIPAEYLSKVFDPFFTTKVTGTGLGLSISFGVVEQHGGHLTVETEEGRGTTFTVWLPVDVARTEEGS